MFSLVLNFLLQGCSVDDDVEQFEEDNGTAIDEEIIEDAASMIDEEVDQIEEEAEIELGLRPLPYDFVEEFDEFGEDENGTEGGCLEPPIGLDCEGMPELEEFCLELSEEEVELMYEATRLLQETFEAEVRGDYCTALEKLDKLAGMVPEESIISNLLAIRLMAEVQGDEETLRTAEALLQHLGYDVVGLGVFFFDSPIEPEPPHSFEL